MSSSNTRPKWWQLYLTMPLLIALFVLEARLRISTRGHQAVQIGIVMAVYGLIHWWLRANRSALSRMDQIQHRRTYTVIRIQPPELPESVHERKPILKLSDSEIQNLLSDSMDMSYLDTESFSMDDARKN